MSTIVKGVSVFLVAIVLLLLTVWISFDLKDIKSAVQSEVQAMTGRQLTIDGDLGFALTLFPTVYIEKIGLANPHWARQPAAVTADRVTVSFSLLALLVGRLKVNSIEVDSPHLWIERNAAGQHNLDFRAHKHSQNADRPVGFPVWLEVARLGLNNGLITYLHKGRRWELKLDRVFAEARDIDLPMHVDWRGTLQDIPMHATMQLGDLGTVLTRQEIPVSVEGLIGDAEFFVSGTIADLIGWKGLNLWGRTMLPDLSHFSGLVGTPLPSVTEIQAKWEWMQPHKFRSMRMQSIQVSFAEQGVETRIQGTVEQFFGMKGINLDFQSQGTLDAHLLPETLRDVQVIVESKGRIVGNGQALDLLIEQAEARASGIKLTMPLKTIPLLTDWGESIPIRFDINSLSDVGRILNAELPETGPIVIQSAVSKTENGLLLSDVAVQNDDDSLLVTSIGKLEYLTGDPEGSMETTIRLRDVDILRHLFADKNPGLTEVTASGVIRFHGEGVSIEGLGIQATGVNLEVEATGQVQNLRPLSGVDVQVNTRVGSLQVLSGWLDRGQVLPETGRIDLQGRLISSEQGGLDLIEVRGDLAGGASTVKVMGAIRDVAGSRIAGSRIADLRIDGHLDGFDLVAGLFPKIGWFDRLEPLLPIQGRVRFVHEGQSVFHLNEISINSLSGPMTVLGQGSLTSFSPLDGQFELTLSGELNEQNRPFENRWMLNASILSGAFQGRARLDVNGDRVRIDGIHLALDTPDSSMELTGQVDRLTPFQSDHMRLQLDLPRLGDLVGGVGRIFQEDNAVSGEIVFRNDLEGQYYAVDLQVADSDLSGMITVEAQTGRSETASQKQLSAKLASRRLNLTRLLVDEKRPGRLFSTDRLKLGWMDDHQVDLELQVDHFVNGVLTVDNLDMVGTLDTKVLYISSTAESRQGRLLLDFELLKDGDMPFVDLKIIGEDVDTSALTKIDRSGNIKSGMFSVDVKLTGVGDSIAEMAGNADGFIELEIRDAQFKNDSLHLLGGDIAFEFLSIINPFKEKEVFIDIECGATYFDVNKGKASTKQGLALRTDKVTLLGGGDIDFGNEKIKLLIAPKARKGLGINTNTLAKMIRVGGTLSEPVIEADAAGLFKSSVALGAAIVTGGLSLLAQGLLDRTKANSDVCAVAVGN